MRGTLLFRVRPVAGSRIIPAHAGNSRPGSSSSASTADHPRACGELWSSDALKLADTGSSPRMRGTRDGKRPHGLGRRIIPAHAGNSCLAPSGSRRASDHPRACGELAGRSQSFAPHPGSSPRMRGTPGRAGLFPRLWSDHPRACGELAAVLMPGARAAGSSPRMRGTRRSGSGDALGRRIIPAHAGNSRPVWLCRPRRADHPRACGELGTPP